MTLSLKISEGRGQQEKSDGQRLVTFIVGALPVSRSTPKIREVSQQMCVDTHHKQAAYPSSHTQTVYFSSHRITHPGIQFSLIHDNS